MSDLPILHRDDARRRATADPAGTHNGLDWIEVDPQDQRRLTVGFLKPATALSLTPGNVAVEGGERIRGVEVVGVTTAGQTVEVRVDRAGDFSPYRLRLVRSPLDTRPPQGVDPALASLTFSFKSGCDTDLDCAEPLRSGGPATASPALDYTARDYEGFRRLMLDRIAGLVPAFVERNEADPYVAVVEALADAADRMAYRLDAVATEAHLGTARSRISVRRHARLLDYRMHDGCTARVWVRLEVRAGSPAEATPLPEATTVLAGRGPAASFDPSDPPAGAPAFTTLHPAVLRASRNRIGIHPFSSARCVLPAGATRASLVDAPPLGLQPGDLLLFEEVAGPATGRAVDADPARRQVVRLTAVTASQDPVDTTPQGSPTPLLDVEWDRSDALAFDLVVRERVAGTGTDDVVECGVARGNLVLAHHAVRAPHVTVGPVPAEGAWRPELTTDPVACMEPAAVDGAAARALRQDPRAALPMVELSDGSEVWAARPDLLASDRFDRGFVAEQERDGRTILRFGDGTHGRRPPTGARMSAVWWRGGGREGNVGRDTLRRVGWALGGVELVTNPLPAEGGADPEPVENVRRDAPAAFLVQQRAVTEDDWADVARRHPLVQDAVARMRWTGSWWTVFLTLDLVGGERMRDDPMLTDELRTGLDRYRVAGYDMELSDPLDASVDMTLWVCCDAGAFRSDVRAALADAFAAADVPGARRGFFHPDNFTFGAALWASAVVAHAMKVPGVADARVRRLQRWGEAPAGELAAGRLEAGDLEVVRLDNDPSVPEHGVLTIDVDGGR